MEKINDGGSAFPNEHYREPPQSGMTLRDYFAAKAMAAFISTAGAPSLSGLCGYEHYTAYASYNMADAMLKAREVQS